MFVTNCYLPVLAGANATLGIAEIEEVEDLLLGDLVVLLLLLVLFIFDSLLATLALQLLQLVLFKNFEAATELGTLSAHVHSLLTVLLFVQGACVLILPPWVRFVLSFVTVCGRN